MNRQEKIEYILSTLRNHVTGNIHTDTDDNVMIFKFKVQGVNTMQITHSKNNDAFCLAMGKECPTAGYIKEWVTIAQYKHIYKMLNAVIAINDWD